MSQNNSKITPYCKVCHDAGNIEAIYRSHFTRETRDPNSRVTCPTLLALECRYCFKKGHTVKYCSTLKEKDRKQQQPIMPKSVSKLASKTAPKKQTSKSKSNNLYVCLDSDSEEEIKNVNDKEIESFPQLCTPGKITSVTNSYAAALLLKSSPMPDLEPVVTSTPKLAPWITSSENAPVVSVPIPPPFIRRPMKNWADDIDSEDEEDIVPVVTIKPVQNLNFVMPVLDEDW